ncbi:thioesterase family protein [Filobasidium floriforme]|uniref:thioesterase family protein n=1 Tax=Filobasidium floriforme TaxID=5210 RepID=UPI001E8CD79D|nr:thioesterase family protein [Filobasidium floriforme]KAH8082265.1 thioesterase family protein [Filobasidium floriforme]
MTENEIASSSPVELARAHHSKSLTASPIYGFLLQNLVVLPSTVAGTSLSSLILEPQHLNSKGSIHGSVSATIVDWASGNALATTGSHSGVSVDMHVTFMNTCKGGEKMIIKGIIDKKGSRLAFTRVEIRRERDDALVITAIHTKFIG